MSGLVEAVTEAPAAPPKAPAGTEWTKLGPVTIRSMSGESFEVGLAWRNGPLTVISQIAEMQLPGGDGLLGPTWHVSVSFNGKRPKPHHVRRALRAFGMVGAELDNHYPGIAAHYFMPVDPKYRGICECKTTEKQIRELDGHTWSQPVDGPCHGCELEAIAREIGGDIRCPIHSVRPEIGKGERA